MRHPEGSRFERRLRARREAQRLIDERAANPPPPPEPPIVERRKSREDRRALSMSPAEVEDWLKRNGIYGGDRRKGDRRRR